MAVISEKDVKNFWEKNPLCAWEIPHPMGSKEYFDHFDRLREKIEPVPFAKTLYRFDDFRDKRVLEVGCGNGYVLSHYASRGAHITGIDITSTAIDLCKKRFQLSGLKGEFQVAGAEALPFRDNSFDCVCSMGVLHHVPNTEKAVKEIHRVLQPGGRCVVMFYHRNSILYRFKFPLLKLLTGKSLQQLVNEVDGSGNPKGDVFSKAELTAVLKDFSNVKMNIRLIEGWMVFPFVGRFLPSWPFRPLQSWFGWFLYATAKKPQKHNRTVSFYPFSI